MFGWAGNQLALWGTDEEVQSILPLPADPLSQSGYGGYPTVQRNNLGQAVGVTIAGDVQLYDPDANAWTGLTAAIVGLGTGTFGKIQGFNDHGQFIGLVRPPAGGGVLGYVASSILEPTSLAACGIELMLTPTRLR